MKTPKKHKPTSDEDISITDMIHFFMSHKKIILISGIIGTILSDLFANFTEKVYKGFVLISNAKISGAFVLNQKNTVTKLVMNSFYSKETFLNCNPDFY